MKNKNMLFIISFFITLTFTCFFNLNSVNAQSYRFPLQDTKANVTSPYGWRIHPIYGTKKFHAGVDLVCDSKYILAAKTGKIVEIGYDSGRGNYIILQHSDNKDRSTYMHLKSIYVKEGQSITQGQIIGYMGTTGASTGTHLHFQVNTASSSYSSTKNVNPAVLKYTYNKYHTHVYNKYGVQTSSTHPHKLIGKCICGKLASTTSSTSKKYGLAKGCKKCMPVITSKDKFRTTLTYKKIKWDKVQNANRYKYYLYCVSKQYATKFPTRYGTTTKNEITFTNLLPGEYKVYIQAEDSTYQTSSSPGDQSIFYVDLPKYTPKISVISGDKVYSLFEVSTSWKYAKDICKRLNGNLAVLNTKTKNTAVVNMIKKYGKKKYYFIGATDELKSGVFKWVDGTSFSYKAFAKGQPSNEYTDRPYIREDYLAIDTSKNYGWNDLSNYSTAEKKISTANKGFILQTNLPKAPAAPSVILTAEEKGNVKVSWNKVNTANKYLVYYSTSEKGTYTKLGETTSTSFTTKELTCGKTYYFKVIGYAKQFGVSVKGKFSNIKSIQIKPADLKNLKITNKDNKDVLISYDKSYNATGYQIFRSTSKDSGFTRIYSTTKLSYTDSIIKDKFYYYKVRPYHKNGTKVTYGNYSDIECIKFVKKPNAVKDIKLTRKANSGITISYDKASYAKGYQIYRSTYKDKEFVKIASTTDLSYTDTSSKINNKYYYYKVRAYNKTENMYAYSNYSTVKSIRHLKTPYKIKTLSLLKGKQYAVTIKYSKSSYATGYLVYRTKDKTKGFLQIANTKNLSYTDKSTKRKNTYYYYKVRPYNKVNGITIYGNYTIIKSVKFK